MKLPPLSKPVLSIAVLSAISYFFITTLRDNWSKVSEVGFQLHAWYLGVIFLFALAVIVSGYLWGRIVNTLSTETTISYREYIRVHIGSWLQKYIPGQVSSFLGKLVWGIDHHYSKKMITTSFLYENIFLLYSSMLISIPIISFYSLDTVTQDYQQFILPGLILLLSGIVLHKKGFIILINTILGFLKKENIPEQFVLSSRNVIQFVMLFTIPRILNGLGFVLIVFTHFSLTPETAVISFAAYILAGIIGILAFFVPSGIGVREGIIVLLLSPHLGTTNAILVSIYARFMTVIADLVLAVIYATLRKIGTMQYE